MAELFLNGVGDRSSNEIRKMGARYILHSKEPKGLKKRGGRARVVTSRAITGLRDTVDVKIEE